MVLFGYLGRLCCVSLLQNTLTLEEGRLNGTDIMADTFEKNEGSRIDNLILILHMSLIIKIADVAAEFFHTVKQIIKCPE